MNHQYISLKRGNIPIAGKPHSTSLSQRTVRAMASDGNIDDFVKLVEAKNAQNKVIVYSKTYCPYCTEVKSLFAQLNVAPKIIELDQLADETQVFNALKQVTKRSTVPQVFVNGQHVGGCDDTVAAYKAGRLQQMLDNAGVSYSQN